MKKGDIFETKDGFHFAETHWIEWFNSTKKLKFSHKFCEQKAIGIFLGETKYFLRFNHDKNNYGKKIKTFEYLKAFLNQKIIYVEKNDIKRIHNETKGWRSC